MMLASLVDLSWILMTRNYKKKKKSGLNLEREIRFKVFNQV